MNDVTKIEISIISIKLMELKIERNYLNQYVLGSDNSYSIRYSIIEQQIDFFKKLLKAIILEDGKKINELDKSLD
jgi:hypothetical protein